MKESHAKSLGERLRRERQRLNWSQKRLADVIGATSMSINRWEHDRTVPQAYYREKLACAFDIPYDTLFSAFLANEDATHAAYLLWHVPFRRNPFFTGREDILSQLWETFHAAAMALMPQALALSGLGGVGKTQTALEYAYRYANEYTAIFWISAESIESILSSLVAIADRLSLFKKQEQKQEQIVAAVLRWLTDHEGWLVIFDNVEDPAIVNSVLPPARCGSLLFTSRRQALGLAAQSLNLEPMTPEEGIRFLLHRANQLAPTASFDQLPLTEQASARAIVSAMEGLPLALDQAGAYIEATHCRLCDYLQLFQSSPWRLLAEREGASDHPLSVISTFTVAFEQIEQHHPAAAEILTLCAFLSSEAIPEALFLECASCLGSSFEALASDPFAFQAALKVLLSYALLQRHPATRTVTIHRLVQAVLKGRLSGATQRIWVARAICALSQLFPVEKELQAQYWQACERFLPHALACVAVGEQWEDVAVERVALMSHVGIYLERRGRFSQAESLLLRALSLGEQALGTEHPLLADVCYGLADLSVDQESYEDALSFYQRALYIAEHSQEANHPLLVDILTGLAGCYRMMGRYEEAKPLYQRALRLAEGTSSPKMALPLQGLATLSGQQGRYEEAEPLLQRALKIRERVLGPEHFQVGGLLSDLGIVYREQGRCEEAKPLLQRALQIMEQVVGADHRYVAIPLNNLAELAVRQGNHEEAEVLYHRVVCIWEQTLGPTHSMLAEPYQSLAQLYIQQGRYEQAEPLLQHALALREQQLGPQHPAVADTLHVLARLRQVQQQIGEALSCYQRALTIREQALGTDHTQTRATRTAYACLLQEIGGV